MKASTAPARERRQAVSLFEHTAQASSRDVARERVAHFARAVARRHRTVRARSPEPGDRGAMLVALRGYYLSWSLCAPFRLPALDDELIAVADAAYAEGAGTRARRVAA